MLNFAQSDGEIALDDVHEGYGYSGLGEARNNPDMEDVRGMGPIPRGPYRIGPAYHHPKLGPLTFDLTPIGHAAHGRSAFRIHGDNKSGTASHGCIIAGRTIRQRIRDDNETVLQVVRGGAARPKKPLMQESSMIAKGTTGLSTGGWAVTDVIQEGMDQLSPLVPYLEKLKWVFVALAVAGVVFGIWRHMRDRKKGRR